MTILTLPFPEASFRIPGIAIIGPNIHVTGSLDAFLALAASVETKISIAKWEVRQTLPDAGNNEYTPKEIADGDPDLDKTGSFDGIQKPEFFAGVSVQGDITAKLRAAVGESRSSLKIISIGYGTHLHRSHTNFVNRVRH